MKLRNTQKLRRISICWPATRAHSSHGTKLPTISERRQSHSMLSKMSSSIKLIPLKIVVKECLPSSKRRGKIEHHYLFLISIFIPSAKLKNLLSIDGTIPNLFKGYGETQARKKLRVWKWLSCKQIIARKTEVSRFAQTIQNSSKARC